MCTHTSANIPQFIRKCKNACLFWYQIIIFHDVLILQISSHHSMQCHHISYFTISSPLNSACITLHNVLIILSNVLTLELYPCYITQCPYPSTVPLLYCTVSSPFNCTLVILHSVLTFQLYNCYITQCPLT